MPLLQEVVWRPLVPPAFGGRPLRMLAAAAELVAAISVEEDPDGLLNSQPAAPSPEGRIGAE